MKIISSDKFIEKLNVKVYPITLIKFLLNKRRILSYFKKSLENDPKIKIKYQIDNTNCILCNEKSKDNIMCRQHTSIDRVLNADKVAYDIDTNCYFYKNEIYRMVNNDTLVIIYCPHPKLISGEITDVKVRRINPITVEKVNNIKIKNKKEFLSSELMDQHLKCWFNKEFSLVTIPYDRNQQNWCLIANY
jgi:hypothetical protein